MSGEGAGEAGSAGIRLFVGARVSIATANALAGAVETLARRARDAGVDLRWVAPVDYHVTLKYLGWTRPEAVSAIGDAVAAAVAGAPRLTLRVARLGGFPALDRASVVWAGIEDAGGGLAGLAAAIERAVGGLGFAPEARPYHPHVTLARTREARALREVVLPLSEQMFGDTRLDSVTLFESRANPKSSAYREVRKISFNAPLNPPISPPERQTAPVDLGAHDADTDDGWPRGSHHTTDD